MSRILGIDYGRKKSGLAVTDPEQIVVSPLQTLPTAELFDFLVNYIQVEAVAKVVIGKPVHKDGTPTALWQQIEEFSNRLLKKFPMIEIDYEDEALTSKAAKEAIFKSGAGRKKRRDKELVDRISAVIILQTYLGHI